MDEIGFESAWPKDFLCPREKLASIKRQSERAYRLSLLRRWIPDYLKPVFDEEVNHGS